MSQLGPVAIAEIKCRPFLRRERDWRPAAVKQPGRYVMAKVPLITRRLVFAEAERVRWEAARVDQRARIRLGVAPARPRRAGRGRGEISRLDQPGRGGRHLPHLHHPGRTMTDPDGGGAASALHLAVLPGEVSQDSDDAVSNSRVESSSRNPLSRFGQQLFASIRPASLRNFVRQAGSGRGGAGPSPEYLQAPARRCSRCHHCARPACPTARAADRPPGWTGLCVGCEHKKACLYRGGCDLWSPADFTRYEIKRRQLLEKYHNTGALGYAHAGAAASTPRQPDIPSVAGLTAQMEILSPIGRPAASGGEAPDNTEINRPGGLEIDRVDTDMGGLPSYSEARGAHGGPPVTTTGPADRLPSVSGIKPPTRSDIVTTVRATIDTAGTATTTGSGSADRAGVYLATGPWPGLAPGQARPISSQPWDSTLGLTSARPRLTRPSFLPPQPPAPLSHRGLLRPPQGWPVPGLGQPRRPAPVIPVTIAGQRPSLSRPAVQLLGAGGPEAVVEGPGQLRTAPVAFCGGQRWDPVAEWQPPGPINYLSGHPEGERGPADDPYYLDLPPVGPARFQTPLGRFPPASGGGLPQRQARHQLLHGHQDEGERCGAIKKHGFQERLQVSRQQSHVDYLTLTEDGMALASPETLARLRSEEWAAEQFSARLPAGGVNVRENASPVRLATGSQPDRGRIDAGLMHVAGGGDLQGLHGPAASEGHYDGDRSPRRAGQPGIPDQHHADSHQPPRGRWEGRDGEEPGGAAREPLVDSYHEQGYQLGGVAPGGDQLDRQSHQARGPPAQEEPPPAWASIQLAMMESLRLLHQSQREALLLRAPQAQSQNLRFSPVKFPKLERSAGDDSIRCLAYHRWKNQWKTMSTDLDISGGQQLLSMRSDGVIPNRWIREISPCQTMDQMWTVLDNLNMNIDSTLPQILKMVCAREKCAAGDGPFLARVDELLSSLLSLQQLHPNYRLSRHEAMATLVQLNSPHVETVLPQIIANMERSPETFEMNLFAYLEMARRQRLDVMSAKSLTMKPGPANIPHMAIKTERPSKMCDICNQPLAEGHTERYWGPSTRQPMRWNCPKLVKIRLGQAQLGTAHCAKCLYLKTAGICQNKTCGFSTYKDKNSGQMMKVVFTCLQHPQTNAAICRQGHPPTSESPYKKAVIMSDIVVQKCGKLQQFELGEAKTEIAIPKSLFQQELITLIDKTGKPVSCAVSYDGHAGLTLFQGNGWQQLDHSAGLQAEPIVLHSIHGDGKEGPVVLPTALLHLAVGNKVEQIHAHLRSFPVPVCDPTFSEFLDNKQIKIRGGQLARPVLPGDIRQDTVTICLGLPQMSLHPVRQDDSLLPKWIKQRFPGLVLLRSRISNKYLFSGNLDQKPVIMMSTLPSGTFRGFQGGRSSTPKPVSRPDRSVSPTDQSDMDSALLVKEMKRPPPLPPVPGVGRVEGGPRPPAVDPRRASPGGRPPVPPTGGLKGKRVLPIARRLGEGIPGQVATAPALPGVSPSTLAPKLEQVWRSLAVPMARSSGADDTSGARLEAAAAAGDAVSEAGEASECLPVPRPPPEPPPTDLLYEPQSAVLFRQEQSPELLLARIQYKSYLQEIIQAYGDPRISIDLNSPGSLGCHKCDTRVAAVNKAGLRNQAAVLLENQLHWVPSVRDNGSIIRGNFQISRKHRPLIKVFPSCFKQTTSIMLRLAGALAKRPVLAREVAFRFRQDQLRGHCQWLPSDQQSNPALIFIPILAVTNHNSTSTPIRCTWNPALQFRDRMGELHSYNDTIRSDYALEVVKIDCYHLTQDTAVGTVSADISDFFKSLSLSEETSEKCVTLAYRNKEGHMTLLRSEAVDDTLHAVKWTRSLYGMKDLPALASCALQRAVAMYRKHAPVRVQALDDQKILDFIEYTLKEMSYSDDILLACSVRLARSYMDPSDTAADPVTLTESEVKEDISRLRAAARRCLESAGKLLIKALDFSDFHLKRLDSSDKVLETILNTDPVKVAWEKSLKHPDLPRPHHTEVWAALKKGQQPDAPPPHAGVMEEQRGPGAGLDRHLHGVVTAGLDTDMVSGPGDTDPWLNSLGRSHLADGSVTVRVRSLTLAANKVKGIRKLGPISSYAEMEKVLQSISNQITRRTVNSCLGQIFDVTGRQCAQAISVFKACCVSMYDAGGSLLQWDEVISEYSTSLFLLGASAFFDALEHPLPPCHLHFHARALYVLVGMADAGGSMHSYTLHCVSVLNINHKSTSRLLPLSFQTYLHRKALTTPMAELYALHRVAQATVRHRDLLDTQGIVVSAGNVLLVTDSTLNMIRSRTRASRYSTRSGHLLSKFQLTLLAGNLNAFQNVVLYDTTQEHHFLPDLLTKVVKGTTRAALRLQAATLRAPGWLELDPSLWGRFLNRDSFIPKELTRSLLEDLESSPEYLAELKADLVELSAISKPFRLGEQVTQVVAASVLVKPSLAVPNLDLSQLLERKLNYGLEGRSLPSILSKVAFYINRLKLLCTMSQADRRATRLRLEVHLHERRASYTPWCGVRHCQLVEFRVGQVDKGDVCRQGKHYNIDRDLVGNEDGVTGWADPVVQVTVPVADSTSPPCTMLPPAQGGRAAAAQLPAARRPDVQLAAGQQLAALSATTKKHLGIRVNHNLLRAKMMTAASRPWQPATDILYNEWSMTYLCSLYRDRKEKCTGFKLYDVELTGGLVVRIGLGREQRDSCEPARLRSAGYPIVRMVDPDSPMASLVTRACHEAAAGLNLQRMLKYAFAHRVMIRRLRTRLTSYGRTCTKCNLYRAHAGGKKGLVRQLGQGPSEDFLLATSHRFPQSVTLVDLTGPILLKPLGHPRNRFPIKCWIVMFHSFSGRTVLEVIDGYSADHTLMALIKFTNLWGPQSLFISDQGSHLTPFHDHLTPLGANVNEDYLPPFWKTLMQASSQNRLLQTGSLFRRITAHRHKCAARVELLSGAIKTFFRKFKFNQRSGPKLNILELESVLARITKTLHTRPLYARGNQIYSPHDLLVTSMQSSPYIGQQPFRRGPPDPAGEDNEIKEDPFTKTLDRMNLISREVLHCLSDVCVPLLLTRDEYDERDKSKQTDTQQLRPGDLVFDKQLYLKHGDITGSLCRIETLSRSGHMAILSRPKHSLIWDACYLRDYTLHKGLEPATEVARRYRDTFVITSRPSEKLFFVCHDENWSGTRETTFLGGLQYFDFAACLNDINRRKYFPPRLVSAPEGAVTSLCASWPEDERVAPVASAGGHLLSTPDDNVEQDEEDGGQEEEAREDPTEPHWLPCFTCQGCSASYKDYDDFLDHELECEPGNQRRSRYGRPIRQQPQYKT